MKTFKKTTLLALILSVWLVGCVRKEPCNMLPEGYIIVTDGENYRWRNTNITSGFDRESKEEAIAAACRFQRSSERDDQADRWPEAD